MGPMVVLASLPRDPPPDARVIALLFVLLCFGGVLGIILGRRGDRVGLRRLSILCIWLALGGFLVFEGWAAWMVWDWYGGPGFTGFVPAIRVLSSPLHVAAFGFVWLLWAGLLASAMDHGLAKRKVGVVLCSVLFVAVSILPAAFGFEETYGFRSLSTDAAELEALGVYVTEDFSAPPGLRREVLPLARWRFPLEVIVPALVVLGAYSFLRTLRRVREILPNLGVPMESSHLAYLALTTAILWGLARVLSVAQAAMWSSPMNFVEETLARETAAPLVAAALGLLFVLLLPPYRRTPEPTA
jgi:hypothetical protein